MSGNGRGPGVRRVVNAVGTWTMYGAAPACDEAIAATTEALRRSYVMDELQQAASRAVAAATKAEAGCITACAAAGIALSVAACMTGADAARVRQLPDTAGLKSDVVLLKGHVVDFGADIRQMVRMTGARVLEAGTATHCSEQELTAAFGPGTAAALYVVSHLCVLRGMPTLARFAAIAHARGVPVIVDAAAEYDLEAFHRAGADLVVQSTHKFLRGPTAGLVSGKTTLVQGVIAQNQGIGRPMKVGKEGIAGALAALDRWRAVDHAADHRADVAKLERAAERLGNLKGLRTELEPDTTGNPVVRLRLYVDPAATGLDAAELTRRLKGGDVVYATRDHLADLGYLLIDPRSLDQAEMDALCEAVRAALNRGRA